MPEQVAVVNLALDSSTLAVSVIEHEHQEIHAGNSFHVSEVVAVDTTTQKWLITTPAAPREAHMVLSVVSTGEVALTVTEGADRTGVTPLTAINHDRNSGRAATMVIHRGISGGSTDGAVVVFAIRTGATGQASKTIAPGSGRAESEYILKQDTKYVVAAETFAAGVHVSLVLDWYEHTAKG